MRTHKIHVLAGTPEQHATTYFAHMSSANRHISIFETFSGSESCAQQRNRIDAAVRDLDLASEHVSFALGTKESRKIRNLYVDTEMRIARARAIHGKRC